MHVAPNVPMLDDGVVTCRLTIPEHLRAALIDALMDGAGVLESASTSTDSDAERVDAWRACTRAVLDGLIAGQRVVAVPATGAVYVHGTLLGRALGAIGKSRAAEASAWVALCAQLATRMD